MKRKVVALMLIVLFITTGTKGHAQNQSNGIKITPMRELYGMKTDFDVLVGSSEEHYAFALECGRLHVKMTINNPYFSPKDFEFDCPGSIAWPTYVFSPTQPGITIAEVTFTYQGGVDTAILIGNGIQTEPADYWVAELGPGTSANRLVYDDQRGLIYITDSGNDKVIIFSPTQRIVINNISVGLNPVGLALTPDNQKLYVANSGEHSISVIDLNSQTEFEKITVPNLADYPNVGEYMPYEIAVVSDTLALIGSAPPGAASDERIWQL